MHTIATYGKISKFNIETTKKQKITVYISGAPESASIDDFTRFMKDKDIHDIFCFHEPKDDKKRLEKKLNEMQKTIHYLHFSDGSNPTQDILDRFNKIFDSLLYNKKDIVINMHCWSGLGRAPTMLAYLMITRCGYSSLESIKEIRITIRNALNSNQINWLTYTKFKVSSDLSCTIM